MRGQKMCTLRELRKMTSYPEIIVYDAETHVRLETLYGSEDSQYDDRTLAMYDMQNIFGHLEGNSALPMLIEAYI